MAKNTFSSAFRKIDVDQYCDENFKEEDAEIGQSGPDESEITNLLNKGKNVEALKVVLNNAPLGCKNQQAKDSALNLTLQVLQSIKSASQIEEAVAQLDIEQIDVLMKYVYRGFEVPTEGRSAHLLLWHEKVYNIGGVGSIVRVLTDTKRA